MFFSTEKREESIWELENVDQRPTDKGENQKAIQPHRQGTQVKWQQYTPKILASFLYW